MRNAPVIAADLSCGGCGRPLVKEGKLACTKCSCKCRVEALLSQEQITCPHCRGPRGTLRKLAVRDQALCPDRKCSYHQTRAGTQMHPRAQEENHLMSMSHKMTSRTKAYTQCLAFAKSELEREVSRLRSIQDERSARELRDADQELLRLERAAQLCFDPDFMEEAIGSPRIPMSSFNGFSGFGMREFHFKPEAESSDTTVKLSIDPWRQWITLDVERQTGGYSHRGDPTGRVYPNKDVSHFWARIKKIKYETADDGTKSVRIYFEEERLGDIFFNPYILVWNADLPHQSSPAKMVVHLKGSGQRSSAPTPAPVAAEAES